MNALGLGGRPARRHGRPGFEPHQAVSRILLPQNRELLQRVVIPLFAVVDQDQREARVRLVVAPIVAASSISRSPFCRSPPKPAT